MIRLFEYMTYANEAAHHPTQEYSFILPDTVDGNSSLEIKYADRKNYCAIASASGGLHITANSYGNLRISYFGTQLVNSYSEGTGIHIIKFDKNLLYLDGTLLGTGPTSVTPYTSGTRINNSNYGDNLNAITLYYIKLWQGNTLTRSLVPAINNSNQKGMYDTVSGQFFVDLKGTLTMYNELYNVSANVVPSNSGIVQGTGYYLSGTNVSLTAVANQGYNFVNWILNGQTITTNPISFVVNNNVEIQANFQLRYTINIEYDDTLGSATYEYGVGNNVNLYATPNANAQFKGWYLNNELITTNLNAGYEVSGDTTFEARFEQVYEITTNVVGDGAIDYNRQSSDRNIVEFYVIPDDNRHFVKYVVGDDEYTTTPLTLTLTSDITITAYFEEDEKYRITATANIDNVSVYVSNEYDYSGFSSTLFARPFPNYVFEKWSDGNRENPRTLTNIQNNITLIAEYTHIQLSNAIYQYKCFVKDQLDMTAPPKAFMVVDNMTIKEDLITNATSQINVLEMADNVNNGDVIVVYNPKGEHIYNGVITSIKEKKISTSQMQSFYKGTWIYNVYPSATLEQEIAYLLGQYAQGKIYKSTYTDTLVAQRLGGITIQSTNITSANLPTDLDDDGNEKLTQKDMEKWIYELYENYGIMFEFTINMSGANYVMIKVPTYTKITIGNNHYAIQNVSPITTIEETNRLIIFNQDKTYRTTYVATKNGIVEQPSSTANRFDITNTKIVFSDDESSDLVASNLPTIMYNHKLNFTLLLKNSLYQFQEFKLGMPIDIYYNGEDYYSSVLTARTYKKQTNQNVASVDYTCGVVRQALTKRLTISNLL